LQVTHFANKNYRAIDYFNDVDADMVPVPHFGVCMTIEDFHALAERVQKLTQTAEIKEKYGFSFLMEPHLRFKGKPGEQWTMFFKDFSNNSLEFKAMTNPKNLFAKYYVE
jgi:uncharacterized protein